MGAQIPLFNRNQGGIAAARADAERAKAGEARVRLRIERDAAGRPTGWIAADNRTISELHDRLPRPSLAQRIDGTKAFFRKLMGYFLGKEIFSAELELELQRHLRNPPSTHTLDMRLMRVLSRLSATIFRTIASLRSVR